MSLPISGGEFYVNSKVETVVDPSTRTILGQNQLLEELRKCETLVHLDHRYARLVAGASKMPMAMIWVARNQDETVSDTDLATFKDLAWNEFIKNRYLPSVSSTATIGESAASMLEIVREMNLQRKRFHIMGLSEQVEASENELILQLCQAGILHTDRRRALANRFRRHDTLYEAFANAVGSYVCASAPMTLGAATMRYERDLQYENRKIQISLFIYALKKIGNTASTPEEDYVERISRLIVVWPDGRSVGARDEPPPKDGGGLDGAVATAQTWADQARIQATRLDERVAAAERELPGKLDGLKIYTDNRVNATQTSLAAQIRAVDGRIGAVDGRITTVQTELTARIGDRNATTVAEVQAAVRTGTESITAHVNTGIHAAQTQIDQIGAGWQSNLQQITNDGIAQITTTSTNAMGLQQQAMDQATQQALGQIDRLRQTALEQIAAQQQAPMNVDPSTLQQVPMHVDQADPNLVDQITNVIQPRIDQINRSIASIRPVLDQINQRIDSKSAEITQACLQAIEVAKQATEAQIAAIRVPAEEEEEDPDSDVRFQTQYLYIQLDQLEEKIKNIHVTDDSIRQAIHDQFSTQVEQMIDQKLNTHYHPAPAPGQPASGDVEARLRRLETVAYTLTDDPDLFGPIVTPPTDCRFEAYTS